MAGGFEPGPIRSGSIPPVAGNDGPCFISGQTPEAIITEGQFQEGVVLRPTDIRTIRGGNDDGEQNPPAGGDDHGDDRGQTIKDSLADFGGRGEEEGDRDSREDQHDLQLLGQESEADEHAGEDHPPGPRPISFTTGIQFQRPHDRVAGGDHQQDQQGVRIVETEHESGDRGRDEGSSGDDSGPVAPVSAYQSVNQVGGRHAHQGLREKNRERVESEKTHREGHEPERGGWLIHGDGVPRVERSPQEGFPALRPGLGCGRVEFVRITGSRQIDEEDASGRDEQQADRSPISRSSFREEETVGVGQAVFPLSSSNSLKSSLRLLDR